jgi:hypothetical protein
MMIGNTNRKWKIVSVRDILEPSKPIHLQGKNMTSSMLTYSGATIPSFFAKKSAAQPGLSLRDWINVFAGALAMASAVPSTGRVSAKQLAQVRAMAETI